MSIADEIEAVALGPAPEGWKGNGSRCVRDWSRHLHEGHHQIMDALDAMHGDCDKHEDWHEFCNSDETLQRMFLLSVAESLRP